MSKLKKLLAIERIETQSDLEELLFLTEELMFKFTNYHQNKSEMDRKILMLKGRNKTRFIAESSFEKSKMKRFKLKRLYSIGRMKALFPRLEKVFELFKHVDISHFPLLEAEIQTVQGNAENFFLRLWR